MIFAKEPMKGYVLIWTLDFELDGCDLLGEMRSSAVTQTAATPWPAWRNSAASTRINLPAMREQWGTLGEGEGDCELT